jgi:hypothetical protein
MTRYLLKLWHRFTLGRTACPDQASAVALQGALVELVLEARIAALRGALLGVRCGVFTRKATDLPPGVVRIVLETNDAL